MYGIYQYIKTLLGEGTRLRFALLAGVLSVVLLCIVFFRLRMSGVTLKDAKVEHIELLSKQSPDSSEHIKRQAVLVRYPGAQATLVVCHGFMCDKYDVGFLRTMLPVGMLNYLCFDFRAHGEHTQGQQCTFGYHEVCDVKAAVDFVRNDPVMKHLPVIGYAFSMGAVSCIEAQAQHPKLFDALILDCPFDSAENVIRRGLDNLKFNVFGYEFDVPGKGMLERYMFHPYIQNLVTLALKSLQHTQMRDIPIKLYPITPVESVKKITEPCFFIHCRNDEKVSLQAVNSLYENAPGHKKLWITNGRRHFDSFFYNPEKYVHKITKFIRNVISGVQYQRAPKITEDPIDTRVTTNMPDVPTPMQTTAQRIPEATS